MLSDFLRISQNTQLESVIRQYYHFMGNTALLAWNSESVN